jgi:DNA-binding MarR family transcriptional regulator
MFIQLIMLWMKLEDEIKQRKFKNELHKLVVNLKFTASWMGGRHNKLFRSHGISSQQFNVLRILKGQFPNPSSLVLVRERMLDKESNASRLIDKLVLAGFARRDQCPEDRRQVDITITKAGMDLLSQINPELDELNDELLQLEECEAQMLNDLLDKARGN